VKQEPEDSEDEPEVQMLQDLRLWTVCHTKSYLRQGLCVNAWCSSYYLLQADAGKKLTQRGPASAGRRWTPESQLNPVKSHSIPIKSPCLWSLLDLVC
jgi:hypothetical protein